MTETTKKPRKRKPQGPFSNELLDQLLAQMKGNDAGNLLGESGLIGQLKKQLAVSHHLAGEAVDEKAGNHRNGSSSKTALTPAGALDLNIPRDRLATFEPQLVAKYQRRLPKFDDHVIGMYARGMTVREIQGHLTELYGLEVSPDLISTITDEVMAEAADLPTRYTRPHDSSEFHRCTMILPTRNGHPVKRVNYATEVNHGKSSEAGQTNPQPVFPGI